MPPVDPPGPRGLPLLGVAPWLVSDPFGFCMKTAAAGEGLVTLRVGPKRIYLVSHPEYVRHILVTHAANFQKGPIMDGIRVALGNGLFTADGQKWKRQRRLMQPAFHTRQLTRIDEHVPVLLEEAIARWQPAIDAGTPLDLLAETTRLNIDIVLRTLLGVTMDPAEAEQLRELTNEVFAGMTRRVWTFFVPPWLPIPGRSAYRKSVADLDAHIYRIIAERRTAPPRDDLLGMLLAARDPDTDESMSDAQVRDEIFTIFVAGYESTATGLSWALYLLDRNTSAAKQARTEIDTVLGNRAPRLADLVHLPNTQRVLSEVFRLYPAFPMFFRTGIAADTVGPYRIPAGAQLVVSPYATHRDPRFWPEPERFEPDRFTNDRFDARARAAYYPFGMGQRRCIGEPMSLAIAQLVLATVLQRFEVAVAPEFSGAGRYAMTYQPSGGLPATLRVR